MGHQEGEGPSSVRSSPSCEGFLGALLLVVDLCAKAASSNKRLPSQNLEPYFKPGVGPLIYWMGPVGNEMGSVRCGMDPLGPVMRPLRYGIGPFRPGVGPPAWNGPSLAPVGFLRPNLNPLRRERALGLGLAPRKWVGPFHP